MTLTKRASRLFGVQKSTPASSPRSDLAGPGTASSLVPAQVASPAQAKPEVPENAIVRIQAAQKGKQARQQAVHRKGAAAQGDVANTASVKSAEKPMDPDVEPPTSQTLSCYCGAVIITVQGTPAMCVACHCEDCRRWGGGVFQAAKLYPADKVQVKGELLSKLSKTGFDASLGNSWRHSCAKCGGVVVDDKSSKVGMKMLPAGLFSERRASSLAHSPTGPRRATLPRILRRIWSAESPADPLAAARFEPDIHICYEFKVMDICDGKPKFWDYPKSMGGSDKLAPISFADKCQRCLQSALRF